MLRTSFTTWLLLAVVLGILVASRLGRALGPTGVVLILILVVIGSLAARSVIAARWRTAARTTAEPVMKNVTPHEPALPPGAGPSLEPEAARGPSVIVVERPDGTEVLAAKLRALDSLRADGVVSDDEYEAKRAELIADF